jgi:hypothetical protein
MSYAKKDEDADHSGFKLDRTSVFQDGIAFSLVALSDITY